MFSFLKKKGAGQSQEIGVKELKRLRDQEPDLYLLDVREQDEWDLAHIQGAHLKPLSVLETEYQDIPKDRTVYCYCKMGGRSASAAAFLRSKGYPHVVNVMGGIQAWAREIDPSMGQI